MINSGVSHLPAYTPKLFFPYKPAWKLEKIFVAKSRAVWFNNTMTTTLSLGNNETISKGIVRNTDGTYTAMTYTQSKTFKTLKGAQKWMSARQ